jgi:hypothetical protein
MTYPIELEGTWEEILTHASQLVGRRVRLLVLSNEGSISSKNTLTLTERQAFLRLPLEERQRILADRAEAMKEHYEQDVEWKDFLAGDIIEY